MADGGEGSKMKEMLQYWYPVCFSTTLTTEAPLPFELFGEPIVLFRGKDGTACCAQDRCPHRSVPLSIGKLWEGRLQCRYHGWTFDEKGKCVMIPSLPADKIPSSMCIGTYPCVEKEGMVWVWPGALESELDGEAPVGSGFVSRPPELRPNGAPHDGWVAYDQIIDQDYAYQALIENLLDPAHLQFTHEGTQGRYIAPTNVGVPEATEITVTDREDLSAGAFMGKVYCEKTDKRQDTTIIFEPPHLVRIEIVFENGWRFHQQHYCIPMGKQRTRLIIRSLRDWLKWVPDSIMWRLNPKVLRQDACVLMAQQLRLEMNASRWNYPVKADALGVRFRSWWQKAETSNPWFKSYSGSSFKKGGGVVRVHVNDMEDIDRCHDTSDMVSGAGSKNMKTLNQIIKEAPLLWPNEIGKATGDDVSKSYLSFYNLTKGKK